MQYLDRQDFQRLSAPQYQAVLDEAHGMFLLVADNAKRYKQAIRPRYIEGGLLREHTWRVIRDYYPIGSTFDYHGVPAMVVGTEVVFESVPSRSLVVKAAIKIGDAIGHITISQQLALALLWRRYNLKDETQ